MLKIRRRISNLSARISNLSARFSNLSARFSAQIPQPGGVAGVKHIEFSESIHCPYTYQRGRGGHSLVGRCPPLRTKVLKSDGI